MLPNTTAAIDGLNRSGYSEIPQVGERVGNIVVFTTLPQERGQIRHWDRTPRGGSLEERGTVEVREVSAKPAGRQELRAAMAQFHYLRSAGTVGEN